jgi:hypothetical protein
MKIPTRFSFCCFDCVLKSGLEPFMQFELILSQKIDAYFLKELMNVGHCKKTNTLNSNNKLNVAWGFFP